MRKQLKITKCKDSKDTDPWKIVKSWLFWFVVHMQSLKQREIFGH